MANNVRLAPNTNLPSITVYGRTFNPASGVVDLAANDGGVQMLAANGWTMLPPHGATSARPTTSAPGLDGAFYDDTISKVIYPIINPPGSGNVASWVDGAGNAV